MFSLRREECGILSNVMYDVISLVNPRRACAARVTVVVLCVCVSVHGSNLLVAQLCDKLVILTGSVSWSLQN